MTMSDALLPPDASLVFRTYARGKLLLTAEYVILDGASGLAVPVRYGQHLVVLAEETAEPPQIHWSSLDEQGLPWFSAVFSSDHLRIQTTTDQQVALSLQKILAACRTQQPDFLHVPHSLTVLTHNDFPRSWGLGTSSTLIAAVARWANVNPWRILADTFGGSGYDLACAYAEGPVLYRLNQGMPEVQPVRFQPPFVQHLWCIYLGKKQNSREGIRRYRNRSIGILPSLLARIDQITEGIVHCSALSDFQKLLAEHETLIADLVEMPPVQAQYFGDYPGVVKSLGAWGGDFVLAASSLSPEETRRYFQSKGFSVILPYTALAL
jgi:mevalonate kinase